MDGLRVGHSPGRGRGIFATRDFAQGELIERTPAIVLPGEQRPLVASTSLRNYYFNWNSSKVLAFALGYGSIYNHSRAPNAGFQARTEDNWLDFVALRPIGAGEEILINYGKSHEDQTPMWFEKESPSAPPT
jgi:uncharacterized protein